MPKAPSPEVPRTWPLALALGIAVFVVYVRTLYPSVPGGDAGELIAASWTLSVPHPPGYPLFAILARAFAAIPFGNVAWRVNLLSAACGAAAAGVLAAAIARATGNRWAGIAAAGLFAFSPTAWEYSVGAEVFALNNLFAALLLLLAALHARTGEDRFAWLGAFVFGLAMSNHHTILFVGIPLLVMLVARNPARWLSPRALAMLVGCVVLGLLPYLYLPLASRAPSTATWGDERTIAGFITHLLRREYGTLRLGSEGYRRDTPFAGQLAMYGAFQVRELLFVGVPLALIGMWAAWRDRRIRALAIAIFASVAAYLVVFHSLANLPLGNPLFVGVQQRFWLMPELLVAALAGIGFAAIAPATERWTAAVAVLLVALQGAVHVRAADRRDAREFEAYGAELLRPLPANALLLARGDLVVNTVQHAQLVEGIRPDVRVVDLERLTYPWMRRVLAARLPDVVIPGARLAPAAGGGGGGFTLAQLVAANVGSRAVFLAGNLTASEGDVSSAYQSWPLGMASRLVPAGTAVDLADWERASAAALPGITVDSVRRAEPGSWSRVVWQDAIGADHVRAVKLLELGIARGDTALLRASAQELAAFTSRHPGDLPLAWKNLGLAYAHLAQRDPAWVARMRDAWQQYLVRGDPADPQMTTIRQLLGAPQPVR